MSDMSCQRRTTLAVVSVMGALVVTSASRLAAQRPAPPALPLQASLATITTDTGDLAPGRTVFTRYQTPGLCLVAAQNARTLSRRTVAAQEATDVLQRTDPLRDTMPAGVVVVARSCGGHLSVASAAAVDLPDLFNLALLAQNDTLARAVLERQIALAPTESARFGLLLAAVQAYLGAEPAHVAAAEQVVAQLDARGPGALAAQVAVHDQLEQFGMLTFDQVRVRHEAERVLALLQPVQGSALQPYGPQLLDAYQSLMSLAFFNTPDSMPALARRAQQDLRRVPPPPGQQNAFVSATFDDVMRMLSPVQDWRQVGHLTPVLRADIWFPTAAADTAYPARGRVALFVQVPEPCYAGYGNFYTPVLDPISNRCTSLYETLRQWHAQYGAAGLDVTLVAATTGVYGTVLSGPQTLAEAANNLRWYFLQYLHLPVNRVAVQAVPVSAPLPAPDGRVFRKGWDSHFSVPNGERGYLTLFDSTYHTPTSNASHLVLTDRGGVEVYTGEIFPLFERLLKRVMTGPAVAAPPPDTAHPGAPARPATSAAVPALNSSVIPRGTQ